MAIDGAGEHVFVQTGDEFVGGIGEIACYFLLDRSFLIGPFRLRILDVLHAGGVDAQGDVEIGSWDGGIILGDVLLRIGVAGAAELSVDRGDLIGGDAGASAEGHVLLCMRHAGEACGRLVAAREIVDFDGGHWRERIANDYHFEAVVESGARDVGVCCGLRLAGHRGRENHYGCESRAHA